MTVKTGQMRQDKAGTTAVTVRSRANGWVHYSYTEDTGRGVFSGRDSRPHGNFESRYPLLRTERFGGFVKGEKP